MTSEHAAPTLRREVVLVCAHQSSANVQAGFIRIHDHKLVEDAGVEKLPRPIRGNYESPFPARPSVHKVWVEISQ